ASAAHSPKNAAQTAVTRVATPSTLNVMTDGRWDRSADPRAVPRKPPRVAATSSPPRATLSFTPWKCSVRSRNARKNTTKPEKAPGGALARTAPATPGPTWRSVRSPGRTDGRALAPGAPAPALPASSGTVPPGPRPGCPPAPGGPAVGTVTA